MGSKNHEVVPASLIAQISGIRSGGSNKLMGQLAKRNLIARVQNVKCTYRVIYASAFQVLVGLREGEEELSVVRDSSSPLFSSLLSFTSLSFRRRIPTDLRRIRLPGHQGHDEEGHHLLGRKPDRSGEGVGYLRRR